MNCQNCNNPVNTNENFCRYCGTKIDKTNQTQTQNLRSQTQAYYQTQEGISVSQKIANSMNCVEIDPEEELIDAYIGPKANELKKDFSWCTFLFGIFYPIYRKMWGFAVIWYIINLISTFVFPGAGTIIRIIAAVMFKELYVKTVTKRVNKIKEQNSGKSHEELLLICSKKGGTSVLSVILFGILFVFTIIGIVLILIYSFAADVTHLHDYDTKNKFIVFNDISVTVHGKMEETINNSDWYSASYTDSENNCRIDIYKVNPEQCLTPDECSRNLKEPGLQYGSYTKKYINDNGWTYRNAIRTTSSNELPNEYYYYFIEENQTIYAVEYKIQREGEVCTQAKELLEETLDLY